MNRKLFAKILTEASMFLSKHSTLRCLGMFCLGKTIRATDMEKYFEYELDTGLDICLPPLFLDILKNLDGDEVNLVQDGNRVLISDGKDKFTVIGMSSSEYVTFPVIEGTTVSVRPVDLMLGFSNVLPAIQEKNFSPVMTGISIAKKQNKLIFAGTDSFRLHEVELTTESEGEDFGIILPKIHAHPISKIVTLMNTLELTIGKNIVKMKGDGYTICSLQIQGNYPEYRNPAIMPVEFLSVAKLDVQSLAKCINKVILLTKNVNNFVEIEVSNNVLTCRSKDTDNGNCETTMKCVGDGMKFGVNGKYVIDCLATFSGDCEIKIAGENKPVTFKDTARNYFTCIIRPLVK